MRVPEETRGEPPPGPPGPVGLGGPAYLGSRAGAVRFFVFHFYFAFQPMRKRWLGKTLRETPKQ
jgi:hypothetical protein